ncbi:MAG: 4-hydroxy-3-methylbut-2-enyl diphosphate reductase [Verrucomicrobiae bacterium]|nr:4-hydroxy-3-methylbut-2-enyl diphosphate reductase [Verrucomicrobiae bacterium]
MSQPVAAPKKVNLRTPDVMSAVQAQVESHYRSELVEYARHSSGGILTAGDLTVRLAKAFGFCYGVERAIDLAYASAKVFPNKKIYLLGEIIHNPEVNHQLRELGIHSLKEEKEGYDLNFITADDVVIVPAFGAEVKTMDVLKAKGCQIVDTTCGDVMSVYKRVRQYSREKVTSIIHGKAWHEETKATSSRALSEDGSSHYLVVFNLEETDYVCDYIRKGGNKEEFLKKFEGCHSVGFDPDLHLKDVGVANQTTMLRGETEEVQRRIQKAIDDRYGSVEAPKHFRFFDTICGATQERQDALEHLLKQPLDLLLVVGGYNSSNTTHLAEMGESLLPTYFIKNSDQLISEENISHYNLHEKKEIITSNWLPKGKVTVGVTAGASCPNNIIESTIRRLFFLRGISVENLIPKAS